jgi:hypothetical protein
VLKLLWLIPYPSHMLPIQDSCYMKCKRTKPDITGNIRKDGPNSVGLKPRERKALRRHWIYSGKTIAKVARETGMSDRRLRDLLQEGDKLIRCRWSTLGKLAHCFGKDVSELLEVPKLTSPIKRGDGGIDRLFEELIDCEPPLIAILPTLRRLPLKGLARYSHQMREEAARKIGLAAQIAHRKGIDDDASYGFIIAAQMHIVQDQYVGSMRCIDPVAAFDYVTDAIMAQRSVRVSDCDQDILGLAEELLGSGYALPKWVLARFNSEVAMSLYTSGWNGCAKYAKCGTKLFDAALKEHCTSATPLVLERMRAYADRVLGQTLGQNDSTTGLEHVKQSEERFRANNNLHGLAGASVARAMIHICHDSDVVLAEETIDESRSFLEHGAQATRVAADCIKGFCRQKRKPSEAEEFLVPAYHEMRTLNLLLPETCLAKLFRPDLLLGKSHCEVQNKLLHEHTHAWVPADILRVMRKATSGIDL